MIFKFSKEMYDKNALIKTAYSFTDKAYIHLDVNSEYYIVDIKAKSEDIIITEEEFINEILAHTVRLFVQNETKHVRELILARALASTIIDERHVETTADNNFNIEEILKDWFDKNE